MKTYTPDMVLNLRIPHRLGQRLIREAILSNLDVDEVIINLLTDLLLSDENGCTCPDCHPDEFKEYGEEA